MNPNQPTPSPAEPGLLRVDAVLHKGQPAVSIYLQGVDCRHLPAILALADAEAFAVLIHEEVAKARLLDYLVRRENVHITKAQLIVANVWDDGELPFLIPEDFGASHYPRETVSPTPRHQPDVQTHNEPPPLPPLSTRTHDDG